MDIYIEFIEMVALPERLKHTKDGTVQVSTVLDYFYYVIGKSQSLSKILTDRVDGSSLKFALSKFQNAFKSTKKPGSQISALSVIVALHKFCPDLQYKVKQSLEMALTLDHQQRIALIESVTDTCNNYGFSGFRAQVN